MHQILYVLTSYTQNMSCTYVYYSLIKHTAVKYNIFLHAVLVGSMHDLTYMSNSICTVPTKYVYGNMETCALSRKPCHWSDVAPVP